MSASLSVKSNDTREPSGSKQPKGGSKVLLEASREKGYLPISIKTSKKNSNDKDKSPKSTAFVCGCMGAVHGVYINCLGCGRIACVVETFDNCPYCSAPFTDNPWNTEHSESMEKAIVEKERLLTYDRGSAQRTTVYDDEEDYYIARASNVWLSADERDDAYNAAREIEEKKERERFRPTIKIAIDVENRQIREESNSKVLDSSRRKAPPSSNNTINATPNTEMPRLKYVTEAPKDKLEARVRMASQILPTTEQEKRVLEHSRIQDIPIDVMALLGFTDDDVIVDHVDDHEDVCDMLYLRYYWQADEPAGPGCMAGNTCKT